MSRSQLLLLLLATGALMLLGVPEASHANAPGESGRIDRIYDQFNALRLGGEGVVLNDYTLSVGHLELRLQNGAAFPLVDEASRVRGFAFEGKGRFRYTSKDPVDHAARLAGLERKHRRRLGDDATVGQVLTRAVVINSVPAFSNFWNDMETARREWRSAAMSSGSTEAFHALWELFPSTGINRIMQSHMNGARRQYLFAGIESGEERWRYLLDEVQDLSESLSLFPGHKDASYRNENVISLQGIRDAGGKPGSVGVVLSGIDIDLRTADNRTAAVTSTLTLKVERDAVHVLAFTLDDARSQVFWGWLPPRSGRMKLERVLGPAGQELEFLHLNGEVLVNLGRWYRRGERLELVFETSGVELAGLNGNRNQHYFELVTTNWHPRPIQPSASRFDFSIRMRTRKPFVPVAPGKRKWLREDGDEYDLAVECSTVAPYLAVFGGRYESAEDRGGPFPIRVHSYQTLNRKKYDSLMLAVRSLTGYYEDLLGGYPFPALDIVEAPEGGSFGTAGPGIMMLSAETFHPADEVFQAGADQDVFRLLAHELAHQWFGQRAMIRAPRDNWISESIAEYLSGLAVRELSGTKPWDHLRFKRVVEDWRSAAWASPNRGSLLTAHETRGPFHPGAREAFLYGRGPMVMRMYHDLVGDEKFRRTLQRLLRVSIHEPVSSDLFYEVAGQAAGRDMAWFFRQWFADGTIPKVEVHYRARRTKSGRYLLDGRMRQEEGPGFKVLRVPIVLELRGGNRSVLPVLLNDAETRFRFVLDQMPDRILIDPDRVNLARYLHNANPENALPAPSAAADDRESADEP